MNHSTRRCLAVATATAIMATLQGGCATLPQKSPLDRPSEPEHLASAVSLAAPATPWPSDRWWNDFGDPQLNGLIEEGLVSATDLRVAQARFARAEALVGQTRSRLLPSLAASAQGGATKQSYNYLIPGDFSPRGWPDYGQGALRLDWDLDFWGKNRAALAAARSEAEAAGAEAAAARLALSAGIAAAYADLAGFHAEHDAAADAVKVRARTLELLEGRKAQGLENEGAVERARSALATAQGDLIALDENLTLTRHRIAVLLGAGPDRGLSIARPSAKLSTGFGLPDNCPPN